MGVKEDMEFFCDLEDALKRNLRTTQSTEAPPVQSTEASTAQSAEAPLAQSTEPTSTQSTPQSSPWNALYRLGVARRIWKEELQTYESHKKSWNVAVRETKNEIYQLVGFYMVVQGVLFQGVSQMNMDRIGSCTKIFLLSTILSVLASAATIEGVYFKFRDLRGLITELSNAEALIQVFKGLLQNLREEKTTFQWSHTQGDPNAQLVATNLQKKKARHVPIMGVAVILLLLVFSIIFPLAFNAILCT